MFKIVYNCNYYFYAAITIHEKNGNYNKRFLSEHIPWIYLDFCLNMLLNIFGFLSEHVTECFSFLSEHVTEPFCIPVWMCQWPYWAFSLNISFSIFSLLSKHLLCTFWIPFTTFLLSFLDFLSEHFNISFFNSIHACRWPLTFFYANVNFAASMQCAVPGL